MARRWDAYARTQSMSSNPVRPGGERQGPPWQGHGAMVNLGPEHLGEVREAVVLRVAPHTASESSMCQ
eukprot:6644158-Alexandrium_andersonii.AAC.1